MYECTFNTIKILKSDKNNNFRPKYIYDLLSYFQFQTGFFSYFRKITALSLSHDVKKLRDQKWSFPVVKGLTSRPMFYNTFCCTQYI